MNRRRASRTIALALGAGLLAAASGTANAAQPGQILADFARGPAVTDGANAIAFAPSAGQVRVVDARGRVVRDADVGGACLTPPEHVTAVGAGQVVFDCAVSNAPWTGSQPRRLVVETGEVGEIAGAAALVRGAASSAAGPGRVTFTAIGSNGAYAYEVGARLDGTFALDWRLGTSLDWRTLGADTTLDLDAPTLRTELCAPLRRMPFGPDEAPAPDPYHEFAYAPPLALAVVDAAGRLELRRCGRAAAVTLAERGASQIELGRTIATWTADAGSLRPTRVAHLPVCGATVRGAAAAGDVVEQVERGLVVSSQQASGGWQIRRVPLGGVCGRVDRFGALELRAPGRAARTLGAVSGRFADAASGATVTLPAAAPAARVVRLLGGRTVRLVTGTRAERVRWRIGSGAWRGARGNGRAWSVSVPDVRRAAVRSLAIDVRLAGGGSVRFAGRVRLVPVSG